MPAELSTTSYALLGLLRLGDDRDTGGLTGYELKQRADRTLRFYWSSPAMSQVYSELGRLDREGLVEPVDARAGRRTTRRYRITAAGREALTSWLGATAAGFPVLKHPVALRLLMGDLLPGGAAAAMLRTYLDQLAGRRADLVGVRESLGEDPAYRYPAMVADWGLAYYDAEAAVTHDLLTRLDPAD